MGVCVSIYTYNEYTLRVCAVLFRVAHDTHKQRGTRHTNRTFDRLKQHKRRATRQKNNRVNDKNPSEEAETVMSFVRLIRRTSSLMCATFVTATVKTFRLPRFYCGLCLVDNKFK